MKKKKAIQGLQKYICVPDAYLKGCSDQLFAMVAEDGAHALKYGIVKGMTLIFDREKAFRKGCLSCFMWEDGPEQEYKLSDETLGGYTHLGRLVVGIRKY